MFYSYLFFFFLFTVNLRLNNNFSKFHIFKLSILYTPHPKKKQKTFFISTASITINKVILYSLVIVISIKIHSSSKFFFFIYFYFQNLILALFPTKQIFDHFNLGFQQIIGEKLWQNYRTNKKNPIPFFFFNLDFYITGKIVKCKIISKCDKWTKLEENFHCRLLESKVHQRKALLTAEW